MNIKFFCTILLTIAIGTTYAQNDRLQPVDGMLKVRVRNTIHLDHNTDYSNNATPTKGGLPALAFVLHQKAKTGTVPAYVITDNELNTKMNIEDVAQLVPQTLNDTITGIDPLTGKAYTATISYGEMPDELESDFFVLEEWRLDVKKRITEVQVIAVAPKLKDKTARYWLKYEDVKATIAAYEQQYRNSSMKASLWHRYFNTHSTQPSDWINTDTRYIYLGDSMKNGIKRINTLGELLTSQILAGQLKAYTTYAIDAKYNWDVKSVKEHVKDVNYCDVRYAKLQEEWTFDANTGTSRIALAAIAPMRDEYNYGTFTGRRYLYWLMFPDVDPVLDKYDQLHPDDTIAQAIWRSYFTRVKE